MRRVQEGLSEEIRILNNRLIYLNNLRVGVGKFYVAVVGALFASSAIIQALDLLAVLRFAGLPILIIGTSVFIFDVKTRARAGAVARGIRQRTVDGREAGLAVQGVLARMDEDFFFGVIIEVMNAFVFVVFLASWFSRTSQLVDISLAWIASGMVAFFLAVFAQMWLWDYFTRRLVDEIDEWPV